MELGQWEKATERVMRHSPDAKVYATIRTKSETEISSSGKPRITSSKRLALHHACFKLRTAGSYAVQPDVPSSDDPFIRICKFILVLIKIYPQAAGIRETRHGCLPIHLAAFASCAPKDYLPNPQNAIKHSSSAGSDRPPIQSTGSCGSTSQASLGSVPLRRTSSSSGFGPPIAKPSSISFSHRGLSDATTATTETHLSEIFAQETYTGEFMFNNPQMDNNSMHSNSNHSLTKKVAMKSAFIISPKREEMAVQVVNALLDAYPKGIRMDSEGGRLPLHTACAGRATPRVISTLVTAYPSAARHRNKDGFLPLHLAAHWGVSHPNVCITLLKCYPDATVGRNRWERTPLEEALCMAGENGRTYQTALVRALRKHPSYWMRPSDILEHPRRKGPAIVDVDTALPYEDMESLSVRDSYYGHEPDQTIESEFSGSGLTGMIPQKGRRNKVSLDDPNIPLSKLIQQGLWDAVMVRLQKNPLQAELELLVPTRGGFVASSGFTPLHYACERQPPLAVVLALIAAHPIGIMTRTMPGGSLPLHVACTWAAGIDVVQALITADPGACQVTDELGNTALHSACFSGADVAVVEALMSADSHPVLVRNHQGSLASDICKRLRHSNRGAVLALLTLKKEEVRAEHRQKKNSSSSKLGDVAKQAEDLNAKYGPPRPPPEISQVEMLNDCTGIEVSYTETEKEPDLMWV